MPRILEVTVKLADIEESAAECAGKASLEYKICLVLPGRLRLKREAGSDFRTLQISLRQIDLE